MVLREVTVLLVLALSSTAFAEDEAQRRAREELEKQLTQMVGTAPTRVRVEFQPIDDPNFRVEDIELSVDGKVIKAPTIAAIAAWVQEGPMPVGVVDVSPGRHKVNARVTYHNTASAMVSEEGDSRWKVAGDVGFEVNAGIEVKVIVTAVRDAKQADMTKRIKLTFPSQPSMISKLDDGTMPEPSKLKPAPIDAGPTKEQLAAAAKAAEVDAAAEAKRLAAEEKKRKADEAAAEKQRKAEQAKLAILQASDVKKQKAEEAKLAKAAAAEEKKRKVEEAKLAKVQAAEEKKRKAEEAKLAIVAAAEEKKRLAEEARLAALKPPAPVEPVAVDAGAVVVEVPAVVDAGAAIAAVEVKPAEVVDAGVVAVTKPAPAPEEEGPPWLLIGGGVLAGLIAVIFVLRRSGRVPEIKD